MPRLPPKFNWGNELKNENATLYNQLNDSYFSVSSVVNTKPTVNATMMNPPADAASNVNYNIGDLWVNSSTDTAWILTSRTTNTAVTWKQIT